MAQKKDVWSTSGPSLAIKNSDHNKSALVLQTRAQLLTQTSGKKAIDCFFAFLFQTPDGVELDIRGLRGTSLWVTTDVASSFVCSRRTYKAGFYFYSRRNFTTKESLSFFIECA